MPRCKEQMLQGYHVTFIPVSFIILQDGYPHGTHGAGGGRDDVASAPPSPAKKQPIPLQLLQRSNHSLPVHPKFRGQPVHTGHAAFPAAAFNFKPNMGGNLSTGGK